MPTLQDILSKIRAQGKPKEVGISKVPSATTEGILESIRKQSTKPTIDLKFKEFPGVLAESRWEEWKRRGGKMTSALQKLKEAGSAPPLEYQTISPETTKAMEWIAQKYPEIKPSVISKPSEGIITRDELLDIRQKLGGKEFKKQYSALAPFIEQEIIREKRFKEGYIDYGGHEKVPAEEWIRKGVTFGWGPELPIDEPQTLKESSLVGAGKILSMMVISDVVSPIISPALLKVPVLGKIANLALKHPYTVGTPVAGAKGGLWGALFGALEKAENKKDWAKNVLETAGTFAAFNVIAHPILQFFRPTVYKIASDKKNWTDPNIRKMLGAEGMETIYTPPKTLYFQHPSDKSIILKVTTERIDVLPFSSAPPSAKPYPVFGKVELETFHYEPSLYGKLKDFLTKGKQFSMPVKPPLIGAPITDLPALITKPPVEIPTVPPTIPVPPVPIKPVLTKIPPKSLVPKAEILKELKPLAVEARKYESAEEFISKQRVTTPESLSVLIDKYPGMSMTDRLKTFYTQAKAITPEVKPKPKLPEIKKPPVKKEMKLYAVGVMPDPGLDKFLAEEVRPVLNKAMEAGKFLWKTAKHIPEFMMKIIEPAKLVKGAPYSIVIRGIHKPEARLVEFDQKRLDTMDTNISELEKWFNKFSDKDLENLMLTRGTPTSAEALTIQEDAIKETPKELKVPDIKKAIQEIADFNYKFLQEVAGDDIRKVEDYFYGVYKDPKMVDKFLDYWKSTERFLKKKVFPTAADAKAYGLELKNKNPVANLRAEFSAIANLEGMNWMKEELLRTGRGIYIESATKAPIKWEKVNDPVFEKWRVEPNLARLINNLISTNKITRVPVLNALRKINNTLRTYKFIGSAFHAVSIAKQSVVDSGYLGFAYKKTAVRGATSGFKENDPIFRTPEYKEYIELGGGHKYSVEFEAKKVLVNFVDKVNRGNFLGAFTKIGIFPAKIPKEFVNWMFNAYIPKVKYSKYLDFVVKKEKDLGRITTDGEKIEIIKEGQNFYGMMNERLFGRSGTTTTALRFVFLAPGYAEGNYRTIIKSFSQWGVKGTYGAGRSRFNIVNSLLLTAMLATIGTLIFTKKWPKKPEKAEDIRDLFKIDTGYVDDKGRRVMIDLMTYDKDYWNVYFNVLRGRPDVAVTESITRIGGMKAPTAEMLWDFSGMLMGNKIYDWKGNEVIELTDSFLIKLQKLAIHEIKRLEPISMSVYKQLREKDVDRVLALVAALVGVRATKTEEDKRIQKITSKIYSLKGQQEELYQYLGTIDKPKESIEKYNKMVNDVLDSKMVPQEMRDEWKPKLLIDMDRLLSNKVYQLTNPMTNLTDAEKEKEIEKIKKYLNNFEVSMEEAEEQLKYYWKEHPVKDKWSRTHKDNVRNRKARLKDRY